MNGEEGARRVSELVGKTGRASDIYIYISIYIYTTVSYGDNTSKCLNPC